MESDAKTSDLVKKIPNPTGKGGFQERPEQINRNGTWKPEMVFSYQYKRFMNMNTNDFKAFAETIKAGTCTMVELAAWNRVKEMQKSLPDVKEITDRTEGKAPQFVDITSGGEPLSITTVNFKDLA
jgi:wyosine [tRNA(Phe)-imidazoG37] synthetase (radical SAM superfamily)